MKQIEQSATPNSHAVPAFASKLASSPEHNVPEDQNTDNAITIPESPEITGVPDDPELERAPVNIDDPADTSPETDNPLSPLEKKGKNHKKANSIDHQKYDTKPSAAERALIKYMYTDMSSYVGPALRMRGQGNPDVVSDNHW